MNACHFFSGVDLHLLQYVLERCDSVFFAVIFQFVERFRGGGITLKVFLWKLSEIMNHDTCFSFYYDKKSKGFQDSIRRELCAVRCEMFEEDFREYFRMHMMYCERMVTLEELVRCRRGIVQSKRNSKYRRLMECERSNYLFKRIRGMTSNVEKYSFLAKLVKSEKEDFLKIHGWYWETKRKLRHRNVERDYRRLFPLFFPNTYRS